MCTCRNINTVMWRCVHKLACFTLEQIRRKLNTVNKNTLCSTLQISKPHSSVYHSSWKWRLGVFLFRGRKGCCTWPLCSQESTVFKPYWEIALFPCQSPSFLLSQLLNTTFQLALTNKVQEPTSIVSHPEETEEETRKTHSTDASNLTFSAKLRRLYLYLKGIFAPDTK